MGLDSHMLTLPPQTSLRVQFGPGNRVDRDCAQHIEKKRQRKRQETERERAA